MKLSPIKKNITYFLLVLFLTTKMAGIHAMSHSDDENEKESCAICDHAISNSLTPTIYSDLSEFEIENIHFFIDSTLSTNYTYIVSKIILARALFSRPPPFSL